MKLSMIQSAALLSLAGIFRGSREAVSNKADAGADPTREQAIANSAELPIDEVDGWFKISPFGVFAGRTPGRPQHLGAEEAQAIVGEFNSMTGRLGRLFRGVPIYRGHPDVDPTVWTDDRRLGKITKMETRSDGLWGFAEWNSLGRENREEEFWIYPSPRWDAPKGGPRFAPDRLISVGLTNTPRIKESDPVFNSDEPPTNDPTNTMDRTALCQSLGLPPEATDEEILAKITALQSAAADAETKVATANTDKATAETNFAEEKRMKEEVENSLTTARTEAATLRAAHDKALLDLAIGRGRITKAERPHLEAQLATDKREEVLNSLEKPARTLNTTPLKLESRREERKATDTQREEVMNAVEALKQTGKSHADAWAQVKKRTEFAGYFSGAGA